MKIIVEFEFDETWEEDVCPEIVMDDAIIKLRDGVGFSILSNDYFKDEKV